MAIQTSSPRVQDSHLTYHYRFPLDQEQWNRGRKDLVSVGFLDSFELISFTIGGDLLIPPLSDFEIKDVDGKYQYRVVTNKGTTPSNIALTVDSDDVFIFLRLTVGVADPSDMVVFRTGSNADLKETDLIIAKGIFSGADLTGLDYSYQTISKSRMLLNELDSFSIIPNVPFDNKVTIRGGKLVDRVIPDLVDQTIGSEISLPSSDKKYAHFYIEDTTDLIKIEYSAEAPSPVKPQVSPNVSCGYILLETATSILDYSNIDKSNNKTFYIQQGHGSGLDADKLDGAELETDETIVVNDQTVFTTKATKQLIVDLINVIDFQDSVIKFEDMVGNEPPSPFEGDRYISTTTGGNFITNYIYEWIDSAWFGIEPNKGFYLYIENEDKQYVYNGIIWVLAGDATGGNGIATVYIENDATWNSFITNDVIDINKKYVVLKKKADGSDYPLPKKISLKGTGTIHCMDGASIDLTTIAGAGFEVVDETTLKVYKNEAGVYKINATEYVYTSGVNVGNVVDISVDDGLAIFSKDPLINGVTKVTDVVKGVNTETVLESLALSDSLDVSNGYDIYEYGSKWYIAYIDTSNNIKVALYQITAGSFELDTTFGTSGIKVIEATVTNPNEIRITFNIGGFSIITLFSDGDLSYYTSADQWATFIATKDFSVDSNPLATLSLYKIVLTPNNDVHIVGLNSPNLNYYPFVWGANEYGNLTTAVETETNAGSTLDIGLVCFNTDVYISYFDSSTVKQTLVRNVGGTYSKAVHTIGGVVQGKYNSFAIDGTTLYIISDTNSSNNRLHTIETGTLWSTDALTVVANNVVDIPYGYLYAKINTLNSYKGENLFHCIVNTLTTIEHASSLENNTPRVWNEDSQTNTVTTLFFLHATNDFVYLSEDGVIKKYNYNTKITLDRVIADTLEDVYLSVDYSKDIQFDLNVVTSIVIDNLMKITNAINPKIKISNTINSGGDFTSIITDNYKTTNAELSVNQVNFQDSDSIFTKVVNGMIKDFFINNTATKKSFNECLNCMYKGFDNNIVIDGNGDLNE